MFAKFLSRFRISWYKLVEQSTQTETVELNNEQRANSDLEFWMGTEPDGAPRRVYRAIMQDLEEHRMVPGQRLIETDLAVRFGVGRNAVREAMQRLAVRGVVDLSRHRSASIRQFDTAETLEVLDVAAVMTGLATRAAALNYNPLQHAKMMSLAIKGFPKIGNVPEPGVFSRARRQFYRALLIIGGNRELQRLFPAIGMHIIYSQFQSPRMQDLRIEDYRAIHDAVIAGDGKAAERAGKDHVQHVRDVILSVTAMHASWNRQG
jgi:DNA-binding GntR family transcriptional regulator